MTYLDHDGFKLFKQLYYYSEYSQLKRRSIMATIKVGKVSVNLKTGKVNIDRRTIKKSDPSWHNAAYVAVGLLATIVVADYIRNK